MVDDITVREVKFDAETSVADLVLRTLARSREALAPGGVVSPSRRLYEETKVGLLELLRDTLDNVIPDAMQVVAESGTLT